MRAELTPESSSGYRYFLHARRREPSSGLTRSNHLFATDGQRVRALRSNGAYLTVEWFDGASLAARIVDAIRSDWDSEASLVGFDSLRGAPRVAIVRRGGLETPQWAAFRCSERGFPNESAGPAAEGESPLRRVHLVAGAELGWRHGEAVIQGAIEIRANGDVPAAVCRALVAEVVSVELRATVGRGDDAESIRLVPKEDCDVVPTRTAQGRVEFEFPLVSVVHREYRERRGFQPWLRLELAGEVFPVPEQWRRFWMTIELDED